MVWKYLIIKIRRQKIILTFSSVFYFYYKNVTMSRIIKVKSFLPYSHTLTFLSIF